MNVSMPLSNSSTPRHNKNYVSVFVPSTTYNNDCIASKNVSVGHMVRASSPVDGWNTPFNIKCGWYVPSGTHNVVVMGGHIKAWA
jgi:hypothetical protein